MAYSTQIKEQTIMDINKNEVFYDIKIIINKLKESNNNEEELVKEIDLLHQKLCLLLYRYNEDFNEKIKDFIRSYDRLDNLDIRKILLEKIRNNEYDSLFDD
jgi:hypothetical protein